MTVDSTDRTASRFDVRSADGTTIAVWVEGDGPALVMAHGALSDHTTYGPLVAELRHGVTSFIMDRRGRPASGDAEDYTIEREFEDVAAVVDAVSARTGGPVALWGHSYGADCAMGAATLTSNLRRLILYEPGLQAAYSAASIEAAEQAVTAGDREGALQAVLVGIVQLTEEEYEAARSSPVWPGRLALVPTLPRELRAEVGWVYQPGQFDGITAPTLILAGSESPPVQNEATQRAMAAIPNARIRVLDGHSHVAHQTDPALVASVIREFIL